MATEVSTALAPRQAPARRQATLPWLREHFFADTGNSLATLILLALIAYALSSLFTWGVQLAIFQPDAEACRALDHAGACWGMIAEKIRPILFGRYPHAEQWRPALVLLLLGGMVIQTFRRDQHGWPTLIAWTGTLLLSFVLMNGGVFGLKFVTTAQWGGLPLTLLLAVCGVALAFPLGILLALGRRAELPVIRGLSTIYIELVRGIPLVSVLFLASFLFPLFLPRGMTVDVLLRVLAGFSLFAAAYLAEVVRGGLQAIPRGQIEAAQALGLSYWQIQRDIVLPQALRAVLPSLMNNFISTLKDTSLVTVVSLYELTGALSLALTGDADWRPFYLEGYLFIGAIYWCLCFSLSRYSRRLEIRFSAGHLTR